MFSCVETQIRGQTYHLLFNGAAMFALQDKHSGADITEVIFAQTGEGFAALLDTFCLLAEQGELARRYQGHEAGSLPKAEAMRISVLPVDVPGLRGAVTRAILRGYGREIAPEETDLGLLELEKKTDLGQSGLTISASEG